MKKLSRFVILMLCFALLFGICGCKPKTEPIENKTQSTAATTVPETDYEPDDLPSDLDWNRDDFRILCYARSYPKAFIEKPTGDTVEEAVYVRGQQVESRLGVLLDVESEEYTYGKDDFIDKLVRASEADDAYDLVLAYPLLPAIMTGRGLCTDLYKTTYFNGEKPWWSREIAAEIAVDGKLYFTADNSSWNNLRNMMAIFVDKDLFTQKHPETSVSALYDLVNEKKWTMETMFDLIRGTAETVDGGGEETDVWGLSCASANWVEGYFYAAGLSTVRRDADGSPYLAMTEKRTVDFVDWFGRNYTGSQDVLYNDTVQYKLFRERRVMFYQSVLSLVEQKPNQQFGVLPLPMYQPELQNNRYYTHFANYYDMYCIPSSLTVDLKDRASAVLECLASEAYRRIAPAYFEVYLKSRNASDSEMPKMYDIIRESIVFDMGYVWGNLFKLDEKIEMPVYDVRRAMSRGTGFSTMWNESKQIQFTEQLQDILKTIRAIPE